jgi:hypothetical protein
MGNDILWMDFSSTVFKFDLDTKFNMKHFPIINMHLPPVSQIDLKLLIKKVK